MQEKELDETLSPAATPASSDPGTVWAKRGFPILMVIETVCFALALFCVLRGAYWILSGETRTGALVISFGVAIAVLQNSVTKTRSGLRIEWSTEEASRNAKLLVWRRIMRGTYEATIMALIVGVVAWGCVHMYQESRASAEAARTSEGTGMSQEKSHKD